MGSRFRIASVAAVVVLVAVVAVVLLSGGDDPKPAAQAAQHGPLPPINGPAMEVEGLVYNVTDVRLLDADDPIAKPYLANLEAPTEDSGFLGVFLRVYNKTGKPQPSAPGFLLEPSKQPGLAEQNLASESPFSWVMGETVPAGGVLPAPGSRAASGAIPGALLLYPVSDETIEAEPFDLVVHTAGGALAKLRLPKVPALKQQG